MNDSDYSPRPDPGYAAWLLAIHAAAQRVNAARSLVNASVGLIEEAESYTKDAALVSLDDAAALHAHYAL